MKGWPGIFREWWQWARVAGTALILIGLRAFLHLAPGRARRDGIAPLVVKH